MVKSRLKALLDRWSAEQRRFLLRQFLFLLVMSVVLTFFLQYRYFGNDPSLTWQWIEAKPLVYLYTSFLMLCFLMVLWALFDRIYLPTALATIAIMIITYIHLAKFELRGTPLFPEDFQLADQAGSLMSFINWGSLVRLIIAIIICIAVGALLAYKTNRYFGIDKRRHNRAEVTWWKRSNLLARAIIIVIASLGLVWGTEFVRHHSGQRYEEVTWLGTEFTAWNQVTNYDDNGFILGFLYNTNKFTFSAPGGYNAETMDEISTEYAQRAEAGNASRTSLADTDYNIIFILNESFYDPSIIKEYYDYGDVDLTPNLHKIQQKYPSGQMYSLDYGGGTANIEFEAITGFSNYWANTVPYTDILPRAGAIPSAAYWAKQFGYQTSVIHPYNGGMYKRYIAVKNEGFDTFITQDEFEFTEKEGNSNYINDRSAYQQTLKFLGEHDEKQFISLITMQNHAPYDQDIYSHLDYRIPEYEQEDWWREWRIANYFQSLHNSDAYLGEFISQLDELDEKTVVLFYGDHSPGVFDKVSKSEDKSVRDLSRLTPYFVYANFDLGGSAPKTLPTTTPNCFTNTLYNMLNVQKPSLDYLLDTICQQTPILTPAYFAETAPFQSTELSHYELINYDILGGEKYFTKSK